MRKPAQPHRLAKGTARSRPLDAQLDRREQALLHAQKLEAVGAFATGISHDFSNVLQVIIGVSDLVALGEVAPERLPEMMRRIGTAARHGADLVHQLMAFARKQATKPKPIDLGAAIVEAVRMIERLMPSRIRIELALPDHACVVLADPVQIEQVLINLATNARDAMPAGGTLSIALSLIELEQHDAAVFRAPHCARLTVTDTGCGMTESVRARVFEPFFTTKEAGRGTGLGLATIATIMRQLDGGIELATSPGAGTTFTLRFRCTDQPIPLSEDMLEATILVVEDDPTLRTRIRDFLVAAGSRVLEAANPDDALHLIADTDAVVADVFMPTMTGAQLCELVRHHLAELPVLLISDQPRDHLLAVGAITADQPFLHKPFTRSDLVSALADVIARSRPPIGPRGRRIPPAPRAGSSGHRP